MANKRKVIFDCDIGCDDAIALIALLLEDNVDIIGITCVKGNLNVLDACQNALKICDLLNKNIPVYKGCSTPMVRDLLPGRNKNTLMQTIHKEIDGKQVLIHEQSFKLPETTRTIEEKHAVTYIIETLKNAKEKIDIVAVGPLTNIAMALRLEPSITNNIGTIYIMGGGLYIGNRTPVAEANFYDDPEAAEIVLNCDAHTLVCPIEACEMAATYSPQDLLDIKNIGNNVTDFIVPMLQGYIDRCNFLFDCNEPSCCIYDYAAIAPIIDESVILEKRNDIAHVDISGGMSDGQLIIDRRGSIFDKHNNDIIYKEDPKKVHQILLNKLKKLS